MPERAPLSLYLRSSVGDAWGALNVFLAAVSIFRLAMKAAAVGLSPIVRAIVNAYVLIFHGAIDFLAPYLFSIIHFHIDIPEGAKDWIVLFFVGAGAATRTIRAVKFVHEPGVVTQPVFSDRGLVSPVPPGGFISWRLAELVVTLFNFFAYYLPDDQLVNNGLGARLLLGAADFVSNVIIYLICCLLWPLVLIELIFLKYQIGADQHGPNADERQWVDINYALIFFLQVFSTAISILGLSFLNAATM